MSNIKVLRVRKIGIDVIPNTEPFIEISIQLLFEDVNGNIVQTVDNWGRIYKRLSDFAPVPIPVIDTNADGMLDPIELMNLVGLVALQAVAKEYNGTIDSTGKLVIP